MRKQKFPKTLQELFTDKSKWCKEYFGFDKDGNPLEDNRKQLRENAVSFCLRGGIIAVYGSETTGKGGKATRKLEVAIKAKYPDNYNVDIPGWNNSSETTFRMVKALVKKLDI